MHPTSSNDVYGKSVWIYGIGITCAQVGQTKCCAFRLPLSFTLSGVRGGTAEETNGFYQAISSLSCLYKHWGFWEEREVRVVAIPVDAEIARSAATEGETKPQKPIKTFLRGSLPVPYLELFTQPASSHEQVRLPIKRVIVGPHREADLRAQAVQRLLAANDDEAEVVYSQIPYIGR